MVSARRNIDAILAQQLAIDRFGHPQLTHRIQALRQQSREFARHVLNYYDRRAELFGQVRNYFGEGSRSARGCRDRYHSRRCVGRLPRLGRGMGWFRLWSGRANPPHVDRLRRVECSHQLLAHRGQVDAHRARRLAHELERTALERAQRHLISQIGTGGAQHHHRPRHLRHDLLESLQAVETRHLDVECHHIWLELADFLERLHAIPGCADDAKFSTRLHQLGDEPAHEGAVVDDQDGSTLFRFSHCQS